MAKPKFKVGDMVYSHRFGGGVVTKVLEYALYPIEVKWTERPASSSLTYYDYFTSDGWLECEQANPQLDIVLDEREKQTKENTTFDVWLNRVRDYLLTQLEKRRANSKEKKKEDTGFKVGDIVYSSYYGYGIVEHIFNTEINPYPVVVRWAQNENIATEPNTLLTKVDYSPINPSHYQVAGIPEAIDIMEHLMTQEQFKGFLWGNIIKYAYRYGRKGDEHDTAGKIEWYANRLKEACSKEKSD